MILTGDPDTDYTKCHECGEWDDHLPTCVVGLREAYLDGSIEVDEFERRVNLPPV